MNIDKEIVTPPRRAPVPVIISEDRVVERLRMKGIDLGALEFSSPPVRDRHAYSARSSLNCSTTSSWSISPVRTNP